MPEPDRQGEGKHDEKGQQEDKVSLVFTVIIGS